MNPVPNLNTQYNYVPQFKVTKLAGNKKMVKICNGVKPLRILVTSGPTREPLDPVRFITNYSTGAMGYAVAKTAKKRKHKVTLIAGPARLKPLKSVKTEPVITAEEMFKAVKRGYAKSDCVIMAAAVSDFRPAHYSNNKLKRATLPLRLELCKNPDILYWLGRRKGRRILVGFCMETEKLIPNAREKMAGKNLDIIVANRIDKEKSAFGAGKTSVIILGPGEEEKRLVNVTKEAVAGILLDKVEQLWYKKS